MARTSRASCLDAVLEWRYIDQGNVPELWNRRVDMVQVTRWRAAALALASLLIVSAGCSEAPEESQATTSEPVEAVVEEGGNAAVEAEAEAAAEQAADEEAAMRAATEAAMRAHTEEALAVLKSSSDFLGQQQSFGFEAHVGFDVLQLNGQKLEFGGTRKATVRRPDRARVEAEQRDGDQMTLFFDGETISVDIPGENAYVSAERPGTLDAALDYLVEDLGTPAPLEDFLSSDLYSEVKDKLRSGFYVEEEMIGRHLCHHLAFSASEVDVQIWIEDGDRPLPCRVVITYKKAEG
ncbi:DUF2092 domain-containing protein, partial [bacterium]|nr:DUF2092 domain-containing protein [bacterium]